MASGFSFLTKVLVTLSSEVKGDIEYAPGKSTAVICKLDLFKLGLISPSFFSIVTPAQLPTFSIFPVIALNNVVFPLFGFPVNAILTMSCLLINASLLLLIIFIEIS